MIKRFTDVLHPSAESNRRKAIQARDRVGR